MNWWDAGRAPIEETKSGASTSAPASVLYTDLKEIVDEIPSQVVYYDTKGLPHLRATDPSNQNDENLVAINKLVKHVKSKYAQKSAAEQKAIIKALVALYAGGGQTQRISFLRWLFAGSIPKERVIVDKKGNSQLVVTDITNEDDDNIVHFITIANFLATGQKDVTILLPETVRQALIAPQRFQLEIMNFSQKNPFLFPEQPAQLEVVSNLAKTQRQILLGETEQTIAEQSGLDKKVVKVMVEGMLKPEENFGLTLLPATDRNGDRNYLVLLRSGATKFPLANFKDGKLVWVNKTRHAKALVALLQDWLLRSGKSGLPKLYNKGVFDKQTADALQNYIYSNDNIMAALSKDMRVRLEAQHQQAVKAYNMYLAAKSQGESVYMQKKQAETALAKLHQVSSSIRTQYLPTLRKSTSQSKAGFQSYCETVEAEVSKYAEELLVDVLGKPEEEDVVITAYTRSAQKANALEKGKGYKAVSLDAIIKQTGQPKRFIYLDLVNLENVALKTYSFKLKGNKKKYVAFRLKRVLAAQSYFRSLYDLNEKFGHIGWVGKRLQPLLKLAKPRLKQYAEDFPIADPAHLDRLRQALGASQEEISRLGKKPPVNRMHYNRALEVSDALDKSSSAKAARDVLIYFINQTSREDKGSDIGKAFASFIAVIQDKQFVSSYIPKFAKEMYQRDCLSKEGKTPGLWTPESETIFLRIEELFGKGALSQQVTRLFSVLHESVELHNAYARKTEGVETVNFTQVANLALSLTDKLYGFKAAEVVAKDETSDPKSPLSLAQQLLDKLPAKLAKEKGLAKRIIANLTTKYRNEDDRTKKIKQAKIWAYALRKELIRDNDKSLKDIFGLADKLATSLNDTTLIASFKILARCAADDHNTTKKNIADEYDRRYLQQNLRSGSKAWANSGVNVDGAIHVSSLTTGELIRESSEKSAPAVFVPRNKVEADRIVKEDRDKPGQFVLISRQGKAYVVPGKVVEENPAQVAPPRADATIYSRAKADFEEKEPLAYIALTLTAQDEATADRHEIIENETPVARLTHLEVAATLKYFSEGVYSFRAGALGLFGYGNYRYVLMKAIDTEPSPFKGTKADQERKATLIRWAVDGHRKFSLEQKQVLAEAVADLQAKAKQGSFSHLDQLKGRVKQAQLGTALDALHAAVATMDHKKGFNKAETTNLRQLQDFMQTFGIQIVDRRLESLEASAAMIDLINHDPAKKAAFEANFKKTYGIKGQVDAVATFKQVYKQAVESYRILHHQIWRSSANYPLRQKPMKGLTDLKGAIKHTWHGYVEGLSEGLNPPNPVTMQAADAPPERSWGINAHLYKSEAAEHAQISAELQVLRHDLRTRISAKDKASATKSRQYLGLKALGANLGVIIALWGGLGSLEVLVDHRNYTFNEQTKSFLNQVRGHLWGIRDLLQKGLKDPVQLLNSLESIGQKIYNLKELLEAQLQTDTKVEWDKIEKQLGFDLKAKLQQITEQTHKGIKALTVLRDSNLVVDFERLNKLESRLIVLEQTLNSTVYDTDKVARLYNAMFGGKDINGFSNHMVKLAQKIFVSSTLEVVGLRGRAVQDPIGVFLGYFGLKLNSAGYAVPDPNFKGTTVTISSTAYVGGDSLEATYAKDVLKQLVVSQLPSSQYVPVASALSIVKPFHGVFDAVRDLSSMAGQAVDGWVPVGPATVAEAFNAVQYDPARMWNSFCQYAATVSGMEIPKMESGAGINTLLVFRSRRGQMLYRHLMAQSAAVDVAALTDIFGKEDNSWQEFVVTISKGQVVFKSDAEDAIIKGVKDPSKQKALLALYRQTKKQAGQVVFEEVSRATFYREENDSKIIPSIHSYLKEELLPAIEANPQVAKELYEDRELKQTIFGLDKDPKKSVAKYLAAIKQHAQALPKEQFRIFNYNYEKDPHKKYLGKVYEDVNRLLERYQQMLSTVDPELTPVTVTGAYDALDHIKHGGGYVEERREHPPISYKVVNGQVEAGAKADLVNHDEDAVGGPLSIFGIPLGSFEPGRTWEDISYKSSLMGSQLWSDRQQFFADPLKNLKGFALGAVEGYFEKKGQLGVFMQRNISAGWTGMWNGLEKYVAGLWNSDDDQSRDGLNMFVGGAMRTAGSFTYYESGLGGISFGSEGIDTFAKGYGYYGLGVGQSAVTLDFALPMLGAVRQFGTIFGWGVTFAANLVRANVQGYAPLPKFGPGFNIAYYGLTPIGWAHGLGKLAVGAKRKIDAAKARRRLPQNVHISAGITVERLPGTGTAQRPSGVRNWLRRNINHRLRTQSLGSNPNGVIDRGWNRLSAWARDLTASSRVRTGGQVEANVSQFGDNRTLLAQAQANPEANFVVEIDRGGKAMRTRLRGQARPGEAAEPELERVRNTRAEIVSIEERISQLRTEIEGLQNQNTPAENRRAEIKTRAQERKRLEKRLRAKQAYVARNSSSLVLTGQEITELSQASTDAERVRLIEQFNSRTHSGNRYRGKMGTIAELAHNLGFLGEARVAHSDWINTEAVRLEAARVEAARIEGFSAGESVNPRQLCHDLSAGTEAHNQRFLVRSAEGQVLFEGTGNELAKLIRDGINGGRMFNWRKIAPLISVPTGANQTKELGMRLGQLFAEILGPEETNRLFGRHSAGPAAKYTVAPETTGNTAAPTPEAPVTPEPPTPEAVEPETVEPERQPAQPEETAKREPFVPKRQIKVNGDSKAAFADVSTELLERFGRAAEKAGLTELTIKGDVHFGRGGQAALERLCEMLESRSNVGHATLSVAEGRTQVRFGSAVNVHTLNSGPAFDVNASKPLGVNGQPTAEVQAKQRGSLLAARRALRQMGVAEADVRKVRSMKDVNNMFVQGSEYIGKNFGEKFWQWYASESSAEFRASKRGTEFAKFLLKQSAPSLGKKVKLAGSNAVAGILSFFAVEELLDIFGLEDKKARFAILIMGSHAITTATNPVVSRLITAAGRKELATFKTSLAKSAYWQERFGADSFRQAVSQGLRKSLLTKSGRAKLGKGGLNLFAGLGHAMIATALYKAILDARGVAHDSWLRGELAQFAVGMGGPAAAGWLGKTGLTALFGAEASSTAGLVMSRVGLAAAALSAPALLFPDYDNSVAQRVSENVRQQRLNNDHYFAYSVQSVFTALPIVRSGYDWAVAYEHKEETRKVVEADRPVANKMAKAYRSILGGMLFNFDASKSHSEADYDASNLQAIFRPLKQLERTVPTFKNYRPTIQVGTREDRRGTLMPIMGPAAYKVWRGAAYKHVITRLAQGKKIRPIDLKWMKEECHIKSPAAFVDEVGRATIQQNMKFLAECWVSPIHGTATAKAFNGKGQLKAGQVKTLATWVAGENYQNLANDIIRWRKAQRMLALVTGKAKPNNVDEKIGLAIRINGQLAVNTKSKAYEYVAVSLMQQRVKKEKKAA